MIAQSERYCLHVGFHKTASTWMQRTAFHLHPDLALLNYPGSDLDGLIVSELINGSDFGYDPHRVQVAIETQASGQPEAQVLVLSEENLSGHVYSGCNAQRNANRLHSMFGRSRVFIVIRNQRDYITSAYQNYLRHGGTWVFDRWIDDHEYPVRAIFQKLQYDQFITYYLARFGRERVLVVPYEILKTEGPHVFLNTLYQFLGVAALSRNNVNEQSTQFINKSYSNLGGRVARLVNSLGGSASPQVGRVLRGLDKYLLAPLSGKRAVPIGPAHEARIRDAFRISNRATSALIGQDLGLLGYPV